MNQIDRRGDTVAELTDAALLLMDKAAGGPGVLEAKAEQQLPAGFSLELSKPNFLSDKARWALLGLSALMAFVLLALMAYTWHSALETRSSVLNSYFAVDLANLNDYAVDLAEKLNLSGDLGSMAWIILLAFASCLLVAVLAVMGYGNVKLTVGKEAEPSANGTSEEPSHPIEITQVEPTEQKIADEVIFTLTGKGFRDDLNSILERDGKQIDGENSEVQETSMKCKFKKNDDMVAGDWQLRLSDPDNAENFAEKKVRLID